MADEVSPSDSAVIAELEQDEASIMASMDRLQEMHIAVRSSDYVLSGRVGLRRLRVIAAP